MGFYGSRKPQSNQRGIETLTWSQLAEIEDLASIEPAWD